MSNNNVVKANDNGWTYLICRVRKVAEHHHKVSVRRTVHGVYKKGCREKLWSRFLKGELCLLHIRIKEDCCSDGDHNKEDCSDNRAGRPHAYNNGRQAYKG